MLSQYTRCFTLLALAWFGIADAYAQDEIAGRVFEVVEGKEVGIAEVKMDLLQDGEVIEGAMTDEEGQYAFTKLDPGTYTVRLTDPPSDWEVSPESHTVKLAASKVGAEVSYDFEVSRSRVIISGSRGGPKQDATCRTEVAVAPGTVVFPVCVAFAPRAPRTGISAYEVVLTFDGRMAVAGAHLEGTASAALEIRSLTVAPGVAPGQARVRLEVGSPDEMAKLDLQSPVLFNLLFRHGVPESRVRPVYLRMVDQEGTVLPVHHRSSGFVQAAAVEATAAQVPERFALHDNYPNPFNPRTTLRFDVAEAGPVTLTVYNVLGRQVRVLADGIHEPGAYAVTWDGRDEAGRFVASGLYLARFAAPGHVQVRSMHLLK